MSLQLDFSSPDDATVLHDFIEWRAAPEPSAAGMQDRTPRDSSNPALEELLNRIAGGHPGAFTELHQHCRPLMQKIAFSILQNRSLADEAVQEALIKIWQRSSQFDAARGNARTWIAVITRNQALDIARYKKHPEISIDEDPSACCGPIDVTVEPMDIVDMHNSLVLIQDAIAIMPKPMRQSVLMSCYQGYTHTEIAEHMQAPVGTVKAWIRRGTQRLRTSIAPEAFPQFANV